MKNRLNHQGFALAFSLIFLFLIVAFVGTLIMVATNGLSSSKKVSDSKRAFYVADAGLSDTYIQLRNNLAPPSSFTVTNNAYAMGNGNMASYSVNAVSNGATYPTYTLTSTGTYQGMSKTLVLRVKQSAISTFAYLSNTEIHPQWGQLWWISGMTTVGPVRTNGSLNIWGSPVFDGTTTQSGAAINYWAGAPNNPDFVFGLTLNAPTIPFPTTTMLNSLSAAASSAGLLLVGDGDTSLAHATHVVFNADGTITVTNPARNWVNHTMAIPSNGVVYVQDSAAGAGDGNVIVRGTIHGQATVVGDSQVSIDGNLVYNTDPRTHPESTDILGLVSRNDVTVLAEAAPASLELDAVLVALNGAFQVDEWWLTGLGNMIQYGSLINEHCGPTGIFDPGSGTLYGGYNQLQYYDNRLQNIIPPGFPPATDATGRSIYTKLGFQQS